MCTVVAACLQLESLITVQTTRFAVSVHGQFVLITKAICSGLFGNLCNFEMRYLSVANFPAIFKIVFAIS